MILEVYTRLFIPPTNLDETITFYKTFLNGTETLHFSYPEKGLELVAVSSEKLSVLIIAGSEECLEPFRATKLTIRVDSLERYADLLVESGCEMLENVQETPVGWKMRARHVDGVVVEYVQFSS